MLPRSWNITTLSEWMGNFRWLAFCCCTFFYFGFSSAAAFTFARSNPPRHEIWKAPNLSVGVEVEERRDLKVDNHGALFTGKTENSITGKFLALHNGRRRSDGTTIRELFIGAFLCLFCIGTRQGRVEVISRTEKWGNNCWMRKGKGLELSCL